MYKSVCVSLTVKDLCTMVDVSVGVEKGCHWGWGWIQFDISKIKKETNDKYDFRLLISSYCFIPYLYGHKVK